MQWVFIKWSPGPRPRHTRVQREARLKYWENTSDANGPHAYRCSDEVQVVFARFQHNAKICPWRVVGKELWKEEMAGSHQMEKWGRVEGCGHQMGEGGRAENGQGRAGSKSRLTDCDAACASCVNVALEIHSDKFINKEMSYNTLIFTPLLLLN